MAFTSPSVLGLSTPTVQRSLAGSPRALPRRIEFELRFGGSPRLTIIYERSYEGFGSVAVQLLRREADGGNAQVLNGQVLLDGLHRDTRNVTLTEVATLNVKMPAMARFPGGFGVRPHTSDLLARLTFRPRGTGSKFKLRYVGSC